jgi:hypothetical protein
MIEAYWGEDESYRHELLWRDGELAISTHKNNSGVEK